MSDTLSHPEDDDDDDVDDNDNYEDDATPGPKSDPIREDDGVT